MYYWMRKLAETYRRLRNRDAIHGVREVALSTMLAPVARDCVCAVGTPYMASAWPRHPRCLRQSRGIAFAP